MSDLNRRSFLLVSSAAAGSVVLSSAPNFGFAQQTPDDLISRMTWMNEPASSKRNGDELTVRSRPKTDFWRKTYYDYVNDNGHFFHFTAKGNFVFDARVNGAYAAQYDQAGIMVRQDAENWMKCGTEYFDGSRHASVVFTRDFSDWSTMKDLSDTAPVWWRAARHKNSIEVYCSLDGKNFTMFRSGYFPPSEKAEVGIMCCAPEGQGFDATFDRLAFSRRNEEKTPMGNL